MKKLFTLFLFALLFFSFNDGQAQKGFAITLRGGYETGGYEATHTGVGLGKFAFRADVSYAFLPILDAYVAYNRSGFACGQDQGGFCKEASVDFTTSGFNLGLRLNRGPQASEWIPWLRAGLAYQTLEWNQESQSYSDAGIGFEIGAGLAYPVTEQIKIVPSVNYTRYSITGANGVDNTVVGLSALIGARYEF